MPSEIKVSKEKKGRKREGGKGQIKGTPLEYNEQSNNFTFQQ